MKVDLTDLNPGVFFPWDEKKPKAGGITIRDCSVEESKRISKETTRIEKKFRRHQPYDEVIVDEDKRDKLQWDYIIVDWSGVFNKEGKELPCNTANKFALMNGSPKFAQKVIDCLDKITEGSVKQEALVEKNSKPS